MRVFVSFAPRFLVEPARWGPSAARKYVQLHGGCAQPQLNRRRHLEKDPHLFDSCRLHPRAGRRLMSRTLRSGDYGFAACWQGGYNDRFAAGRPTAAAAFGMRLDLAPRVAQLPKTHPWRWAIDLPKSGWGLHSESFVRTALEDARVRPVFSAEPFGHRVRVRGTESVTDCENLTAWQPGRHQCLPLRDLKFPPGV